MASWSPQTICQACGYDLSGHTGYPKRCPECGRINTKQELEYSGTLPTANGLESPGILTSGFLYLAVLGLFLLFWSDIGWLFLAIGVAGSVGLGTTLLIKCRKNEALKNKSRALVSFIARTTFICIYVSAAVALPFQAPRWMRLPLSIAYPNSILGVVCVFAVFVVTTFLMRGFFANWIRSYESISNTDDAD
ncbi:MAG TPA: hypothetical protein PKN33_16760 [Phycisphaerae bacterium]|nr:hypothetical protein [Phycisphaerae bacterium]